jgi:hypothetical protein
MSIRLIDKIDGPDEVRATGIYEPPTLTALGNARELLAGAGGSITDATPDPEGGQVFQTG